MKRTQIQLPDWLFAAAHDLAESKEISLAELVRRGLEYMVAVTPNATEAAREWAIPEARALGSNDPFADPDWREQLHMQRSQVAEDGEPYGTEESS